MNAMRLLNAILLSTAALLWACAAPSAHDKSASEPLTGDAAALQGVWTVTRNEIATVLAPEMHGRHFIFRDNKFQLDGDTGWEVFAINEETLPKEIDFIAGSSVIKGIYSIDHDYLTLCTAPPGIERPSRYETSAGLRIILTNLKRAEHPAGGGTQPAVAADEPLNGNPVREQ